MARRLPWATALLATAAIAVLSMSAIVGQNPTGHDAAAGTGPVDAAAQAQLDRELIAAAWVGDVDTATRLIAAGADVNARDWTRQSAYLIAASEGHHELLELTIASGAFVPLLDSYRGTALIRAAERGHATIVGRLLQEPAMPVDHVNRLGWTALHEAVILGDGSGRYVDTVRLLVAGGADLSRVSVRDDMTALEHARDLGQERVVELLARAADAEPEGDPGAALLDAVRVGDADAAAIAIRHGADPTDGNAREALRLATVGDHGEVVRLLTALGVTH